MNFKIGIMSWLNRFLPGAECKKCKGTGVKEPESFHLGSMFFGLVFELGLPLILLIAPFNILSAFGMRDLSRALDYWLIIAVFCFVMILLSMTFISPVFKKLLFGICASCNGTGKMK